MPSLHLIADFFLKTGPLTFGITSKVRPEMVVEYSLRTIRLLVQVEEVDGVAGMVCGPTELERGMEHEQLGAQWRVDMLFESCRLMVEMSGSNELSECLPCLVLESVLFCECRFARSGEAEILSIKPGANGERRFYVHYVDCNRRLDEWVSERQLDLKSVKLPQKIRRNIQIPSATVAATESYEVFDSG